MKHTPESLLRDAAAVIALAAFAVFVIAFASISTTARERTSPDFTLAQGSAR